MDLLVIGAGPTGLFMAAEAARHGLSCRIIDKAPSPSLQSKALAIQPRTLEILSHLGIIDPFLSQGLKVHAANPISHFRPLARLSFEGLDSPFPFILSLEQSHTERILTDYLSSFGISIERDVEFLDLQQNAETVTATLLHQKTGQKEHVTASYLTGCDGAHSAVRKTLNIPFSGTAFPSAFSLADVEISWKYPHDELFLFLTPEGILAAIPMPGANRYRLVFPSAQEPTLAQAEERVRRYADPQAHLSNSRWMAHFHIHSRLVKSYQKGRVFLAGDAAHIHSPAGGQGMNSGFQDAFNLIWKLKYPHLLPTYTLERHAWAKNLLRTTRFATWVASWQNPLAQAPRNWGIEHLVPFCKVSLTRAIAQLSIHYPPSAIVRNSGSFNGGPPAGTRAPNTPLFLHGQKTDLYTLLRRSTRYHLLCFADSLPPSPIDAIPLLIRNNTAANAIYGIQQPSTYLIRPDLYIAARENIKLGKQ